jgi:hypothetical protein
LAASYQFYTANLPEAFFPQEVPAQNQRIPTNIQQVLSPDFVDELSPAIDKENKAFQHRNCFATVSLPYDARYLPGLWVFTRKRDGTPTARFCVGGHRHIMGRDYFPNKVIALFSPVATLASCWRWLLLKGTLSIRLTLFGLF